MRSSDAMALSQPISRIVETNGSVHNTFDDSTEKNEHVVAWNDVINYKLIEWGRNPSALEDDGFDPPSNESIRVAAELVVRLRDSGMPPMPFVVPDGDGGISFEDRCDDDCAQIRVSRDGSAEFIYLSNYVIVERYVI